MSVQQSSQKMTRVLVTGGSGFLGGHVVQQLLDDPAISVAIVSRKPKAATAADKDKDRLSYHAADITSEEQIRAILDQVKPQVVIHTASPHFLEAAATSIRTNVEGTKVLLQSAKACLETRAFVYTSSAFAVVPTQEPLTEDKAELYSETHFVNPYGMSKAVADAMVLAANSADLHTAVIRLPGIYGENDNVFFPSLISTVRKQQHKMQFGRSKNVLEWVYVKKAAEAHILAARALLDPQSTPAVAGEAFFITDGRPQPFFDFIRRCYAAMGHPVGPEEVTVIPMAVMQAIVSAGEWAYMIFTLGTKMPTLRRNIIDELDKGYCWSIEKAKQRLGYQPVADQDEAIKRSMEWAIANM